MLIIFWKCLEHILENKSVTNYKISIPYINQNHNNLTASWLQWPILNNYNKPTLYIIELNRSICEGICHPVLSSTFPLMRQLRYNLKPDFIYMYTCAQTFSVHYKWRRTFRVRCSCKHTYMQCTLYACAVYMYTEDRHVNKWKSIKTILYENLLIKTLL